MPIREQVLLDNFNRLEEANKLRQEQGGLEYIENTQFKKTFFGMNAKTGRRLTGANHIKQSIDRILTTKKNTRYLSRDFGSELLNLSDTPSNPVGLLLLKQAINIAISDFEPRVEVKKADIKQGIDGKLDYTLDYDILDF